MGILRQQLAQWTGQSAAGPLPPVQGSQSQPAPATPAKVESAAPSPRPAEPLAEAQAYFAYKTKLHQDLLKRIDLRVLETLPADQLREQLRSAALDMIREEALPLNEIEHDRLVRDLQHEILGLGPLEPLLADPSISEIMVNGAKRIFVERRGLVELTDVRFDDDAHLLKVIGRIVSRVGRRIDESSPMADARLPDGSRVNAIIPPLALDGPVLTIRRFSAVPLQMHDLIERGALTADMAALLAGMVKAKANIIVSGGTGSGKTTLLNILSSFVPAKERIITLEDTAELQLQQEHVVRLESRPANIEGQGAIPMRALVKNSLRMRPDRIIVGEVRGGEVIDMLQAMNTGHSGSLATIHANNPRDALGRLENLVSMSGVLIPSKALRQQIVSAVNIFVQAARLSDGTRKITSITEISGMEEDVIALQDIFIFDMKGTDEDGKVIGQHRPTGVRPGFFEEIARYGVHLNPSMFDPEPVMRPER